MILMRLHMYIAKLFLWRLVMTIISLLGAVFMVESLDVKKRFPDAILSHQALLACIKLPFLLHKILPFIVIGTVLLLFLRLIRYQELTALHSGGASLWRILGAPVVLTMALSIGDLLWLTPLGNQWLLLYPHHAKKFQSLDQERTWSLCQDEAHYIVMHYPSPNQPSLNLYVFASDFTFMQRYYAGNAKVVGTELELCDVWVMRYNMAPAFQRTLRLPNPYQTMKCTHSQTPVSLMSFLQAHQAIFTEKTSQTLPYVRWEYLLSNALWLVTLVPFSAALIVGHIRGYRRLLWGGMGILLAFGLYLGKEWFYAMSISFSYILSPVLLWSIPVITLIIATIVLFEKNEL